MTVIAPDELEERPVARDIRLGRYDLLIFDRCSPEMPPEANTLYFGALPPGPAYAHPRSISEPAILDWDVAHPLLQYRPRPADGGDPQGSGG